MPRRNNCCRVTIEEIYQGIFKREQNPAFSLSLTVGKKKGKEANEHVFLTDVNTRGSRCVDQDKFFVVIEKIRGEIRD